MNAVLDKVRLFASTVLLPLLLLAGCASSPRPGSAGDVVTREAMLPSADAGISLYVRNKSPAGMSHFRPERTVLFVHGATYPSESTFDVPMEGASWMDVIARAGYDVWFVDVRGYGRSTRPAVMTQPPSANPPFADTEDAVRDVGTAVDHILKQRGIAKLDLIGYSWGTTIMGMYASRHNERVNKLVLCAPIWVLPPAAVGKGPPAPTTAYRSVTSEASQQRWFRGVPADKQAALVPAGWHDAWFRLALESDPEGAAQTPPVVRAPNGTFVDILGGWMMGKRLYDAEQIRVPTLLVKAEWDVDAPASMAQGLFASLKNAPMKSYVEIGEGTHTLMLERNRTQLYRVVQSFLDEEAPRAP